MTALIIEIGGEEFRAELTDEFSPETARLIEAALPIESETMQWGDEFYFDIPVDTGPENARPSVNVGDLAFWPQGNCFCIFFGKTPMSRSEDEIIPASPVNVIGRIEGIERLKAHGGGETVLIRQAE